MTPEQRAAIERVDAKLDMVPEQEHIERMKRTLSVTRQQVDESLAAKKAAHPTPKRGRKPKSKPGSGA